MVNPVDLVLEVTTVPTVVPAHPVMLVVQVILDLLVVTVNVVNQDRLVQLVHGVLTETMLSVKMVHVAVKDFPVFLVVTAKKVKMVRTVYQVKMEQPVRMV